MLDNIDGPQGSHPFDLFLKYRRDPLNFFLNQFNKYGSIWMMKILGKRVISVADPQSIVEILRDHWEDVEKGRTTKKLQLLLGNGLITSEGQNWRKNSRIIRPVFNLKNISSLIPLFNQEIKHAINFLEQKESLNVSEFMHHLALKLVMKSLFQFDQEDVLKQTLLDVDLMQKFVVKRTRSIFTWPLWFPITENIKFFQAISRFDELVYKMIEDSNSRSGFDLIKLLKNSVTEDGEKLTDKEIRDEVITILMAGHETIATSLSWTLILLSQNQGEQDRARSVAKNLLNETSGESFLQKNYVQSVIDESMRLFPPVWVFMREVIRPFVLKNGIQLRAGDQLVIAPYFVHRSKVFGEDKEEFRPDRFYSSETKPHPGSYIPFGFGPRICIGQTFAQIESQLILSHLLTKFKFSIPNVTEQTMDVGLVIKPTSNTLIKHERI